MMTSSILLLLALLIPIAASGVMPERRRLRVRARTAAAKPSKPEFTGDRS